MGQPARAPVADGSPHLSAVKSLHALTVAVADESPISSRQSIVFDHVADLLGCLQDIFIDTEIVVVRIKNRFDLAYDAVETAGYRDVSINLRIDNQVTWDMGVETHVCEIKLLLTEGAKVKVRSRPRIVDM